MKKSGMACSFCSKGRGEVLYLITGNNAYICDECVDLAADIVKDERAMPKDKMEIPTKCLSFSAALNMLKENRKVCRSGWNGKGMFIYLHTPSRTDERWERLPFIMMKTADDKIVPWLASQTDILAEDWCVIH